MVKKITLRQFDDMHCHFRLEPMLHKVLPYTARYCGRAIAMPNTRPRPILTVKDVTWYRRKIQRVTDSLKEKPSFEPLMTIEIRDDTTSKIVEDAFKARAVAGKVYPAGIYGEGLSEFFSAKSLENFTAMQDVGMLLLLHGELDPPATLVIKREKVFLENVFFRLCGMFPKLKIVLEHVSSKIGVQAVKSFDNNVAATITAHHLCTTLNSVVGRGTQPHNMCNPIPKDYPDMHALLAAATSGDPKFFLGSDSAPHAKEKKECAVGACGVFTAPILPQLLAEIFEINGKLDKLEDFTSRFGAQFYGLPRNKGKITLVKKPWVVPDQHGSVVPFMAGEKLNWQLV